MAKKLYNPLLDNVAQARVIKLQEEYPNAIKVFGISALVYEEIHNRNKGIEVMPDYLKTVFTKARIYKWHETPADTLKRFCHLVSIDPTLIECFIGMKFDQIKRF